MVHLLKCFPKQFDELASKNKTFELRYNDRGYKVGDYVKIHRSKEDQSNEVTASILFEISHILESFKGLESGYVIFSLRLKDEAKPNFATL